MQHSDDKLGCKNISQNSRQRRLQLLEESLEVIREAWEAGLQDAVLLEVPLYGRARAVKQEMRREMSEDERYWYQIQHYVAL
jgi:hypothetical protein